MTAEGKTKDKDLAEGFWKTVKSIRDRWYLIAFAVSALFWARDVIEMVTAMPSRMATVEQSMALLSDRVDDLGHGRAAEGGWRSSQTIVSIGGALWCADAADAAGSAYEVRVHPRMTRGRAGPADDSDHRCHQAAWTDRTDLTEGGDVLTD